MAMPRLTTLAALLLLGTATPGLAQDDHAHEDADHAEDAHAHDEAHADDDHAGDDDHLAEAAGLRLVHAWSRATDADEALIFVEIVNTGDSTRSLMGGGSPHAEGGEIAGFRLVDGAPAYHPLPEVPIAPGAEMTLAPEGLALRLTGLDATLEEGDSLVVSFAFDDGLDVEATAQIEASNATQHSHAGHMH